MKKIYFVMIFITAIICLFFFTKESKKEYSIITEVDLIKSTIDLGVLTKNSFKRDSILLLKTQTSPLIIYKIDNSISNISIQKTPQYFPKGDTISLPFVFQTKSLLGHIDESITIEGNFPDEEFTILIKGFIK